MNSQFLEMTLRGHGVVKLEVNLWEAPLVDDQFRKDIEEALFDFATLDLTMPSIEHARKAVPVGQAPIDYYTLCLSRQPDDVIPGRSKHVVSIVALRSDTLMKPAAHPWGYVVFARIIEGVAIVRKIAEAKEEDVVIANVNEFQPA